MATEKFERSFIRDLQDAFDASNGEWIEESKEYTFTKVSGEMFRWMQRNLSDDVYRAWCPGPHRSYKSIEFYDVPGEVVEEACAPYGAAKLLLRHPKPETTAFGDSIKAPLNRVSYAECIDLNGRILFKILHEFFPTPEGGVIMKNRYHLPKATPDIALQAFLNHQDEEYDINDILPALFKEKTWMVNEVCAVD